MRHVYTIMLALLLGGIAAQAQEADYQPLVREGVRWVNHHSFGGEDFYTEPTHYAIEFHGDTVVTQSGVSRHYKKCYKYDVDPQGTPMPIDYAKMRPAALAREDGRKVYVIKFEMSFLDSEYVLYDFSLSQESVQLYNDCIDESVNYTIGGTTVVDGYTCNIYEGGLGKIIESIGLVSGLNGDLLWPKFYEVIGVDSYYGLDYVEDLDGNIIYKAPWYSDNSSISQVDRDADVSADPRWYDLLGRPHETRPTQPGIYIHQGRKVVVK